MRYLLSIIIILITFYSCSKKKDALNKFNINESKIKVNVLNSAIQKALNLYIKKYPISKNNNNNAYHYKIEFNENIFTIMRLGFFAPKEKGVELKGIFYNQDSIYICIFDKNEINNNLYYDVALDVNLIKSISILKTKQVFDETFPPIWKYKMINNKAILIEKDTIWKTWN